MSFTRTRGDRFACHEQAPEKRRLSSRDTSPASSARHPRQPPTPCASQRWRGFKNLAGTTCESWRVRYLSALVSFLTRFIASLLLALWLPASMHCALEKLPVFAFLQSCCGTESDQQESGDCSQDVCGAVESGLYKPEDNSVSVSAAAKTWGSAPGSWGMIPRSAPAQQREHPSPAPPEMASSWQFSLRAALPVRAPSSPG